MENFKGKERRLTLTVRPANMGDIAILARHHRMMFQGIWENEGKCLDPRTAQEVENAYRRKLEQQLCRSTCLAWVGEQEGHPVASGALSFVSFVPVPGDLNHRVAYLHSIFTEKDHRGKGWAGRITQTILAECKRRGIKRVLLNASAEGRPVYEKIGFRPMPEMMRLMIQ